VTELDIICHPSADRASWTCVVRIDVDGGATTRHEVTVRQADLERLDPTARDPHVLVDASFRFLLEREPPTSILRTFDLPEIGRYFPEYEQTIKRAQGARSSCRRARTGSRRTSR
jgi:hypothetical protein